MNNEIEHKSPRESGEDSEDESEILEESPCGRWLKRREEVSVISMFPQLQIFGRPNLTTQQPATILQRCSSHAFAARDVTDRFFAARHLFLRKRKNQVYISGKPMYICVERETADGNHS